MNHEARILVAGAYVIAKITGIKLAESYTHQHGRQYVSVMPTNLYGPNDNYHLATSHVLAALMHKAHIAKQRGNPELVVWGSSTLRRSSWPIGRSPARASCPTRSNLCEVNHGLGRQDRTRFA